MSRPQDRNLEYLLATSLLEWKHVMGGWISASGQPVAEFRPLHVRDHALLIIRRMEELGFDFEDRPVSDAAEGGAVLASFHRDGEVYSGLAAGECQAICTAASRFVMHRAGETAPVAESEWRHPIERVTDE